VNARDTTPDALEVRTAILRRMSSGERTQMAVELSEITRAIALEGIRRRHPSYSDDEARMALFRLLVGDALFRRAWPDAPLLAP
jgi:hypothetical protein